MPFAKHVEVYASPVPEGGACTAFLNSGAPSPYLECVTERPDLHYQRMTDKHVYFAQHGPMEHQARIRERRVQLTAPGTASTI